jgi:hypothetical protein
MPSSKPESIQAKESSMKKSLLALFSALCLAAPAAIAGTGHDHGHDHGPQYGGVVREAGDLDYELVVKPDSLTLYVSEHGKPIPTAGARGEATIYAGNGKTTVPLEPAGENQLAAKGSFKGGVGVRVAVAVTLAGKNAEKVSFKLK